MSVLSKRPVLRWLVPATAAVAVIGGGAAVATVAGAADPTLPDRSAAQLLVDLQTARLDGLSGTVVQRADLGLPPIVSLAGMLGDDSLASLVDGQHTLRVWYAGPDKARISLLGGDAQTDVIRNGSDTWLWSSRSKTATHGKINGDGDHGAPPAGLPASPQEAADLALKAIDPSTQVSVGRSTKIAGRDAYELNLTPKDHESLVGQVSIAIDATEHVPLRFRIYPAASDKAAFEVAFTMINFDRPDDAQFVFNPPAGTKVTEFDEALKAAAGDKDDKALEDKIAKERQQPSKGEGPTIIGEGWTTVFMAKLDKTGGDEPGIAGLLGQLPKVSGAWGSGRLFTSHLATGLLTDDGRVFFGAVSPERLYEVAASHR
ncbi:hypothetical protein Ais01nite_47180 [Asanoa ishikariensis]|uniref:Outer membrane lipoprotein-sorting protein n=1 Tax=Asanoa ishikariensis TaxID=137265 RepID=A0A1H3RYB6_9ACTN|nr:hypothetical protein [Asanoa ishikariensis]GIF66683.1 hypothetical protein Ais01nite_47180 [Asanoa ishikariensis]SDZ30763.1 Outer membrane lipoprotein-sorting protein [Asanoa ishikariensis]